MNVELTFSTFGDFDLSFKNLTLDKLQALLRALDNLKGSVLAQEMAEAVQRAMRTEPATE